MRIRVPRPGAALIFAAMILATAGCARTVRIGSLLDEPARYDGRTVRVEGTVTRSAGLLGVGAYEVDDGTGRITVIARGQGVPREGAMTRAKGTFQSVFNWAGTTIAAIVQPQGR
jgi:hypothetical protein